MDKFKRYRFAFFLLVFNFIIAFSMGCGGSKKSGCPGEDAQVKVNKKGNPTSKSKSGLFDKKMTKKMGG